MFSLYDSFDASGIKDTVESGHAGHEMYSLGFRMVALQKQDSQRAKRLSEKALGSRLSIVGFAARISIMI